MSNLDKRVKDLERRNSPVVYPVTSPGSKGFWYIGGRRFANLEEVKAAYPGRRVKPVTLPVKMDLADL